MGLTERSDPAPETIEQISGICPRSVLYSDQTQDEAANELQACADCDTISSLIADLALMNWQSVVCENPEMHSKPQDNGGETEE